MHTFNLKLARVTNLLIRLKDYQQHFPVMHHVIILIFLRTCAYQGVRNVSFLESFAYELNEWSPSIIHRSFIRSHLHCTDIIYDKPKMIHLHRKFKMFNIEHARQQFLTEHPEIKFIRNCKPLQNNLEKIKKLDKK